MALTLGTTYYYLITAVTSSGESESSAQVSATPAPFIGAQIFANATDGSSLHESVSVYTDSSGSAPITNATVTVNGTAFAYNSRHNDYEGSVPTIAANAGISLLVTLPGDSVQYNSSGTQFASFPTISAPVSNYNIDSTTGTTSIDWSGGSPTSGSEYLVGVADEALQTWYYGTSYGSSGESGPTQVSINTFTVSFANSLIPMNASVYYNLLVGITNGSFGSTGNVASGIPVTNALPSSYLMFGGGTLPKIFNHVT
jgi:hypothetical protein